MGTNYYLYERKNCPHCNQPMPENRLHIGKSSAGWAFSLHVIPEENLNDIFDWSKRWEEAGCRIEDEYSRLVTPYEMLKHIVLRRRIPPDSDRPFDHAANGSEPAPNGLVISRHSRLKPSRGEAVWSHSPYDFS